MGESGATYAPDPSGDAALNQVNALLDGGGLILDAKLPARLSAATLSSDFEAAGAAAAEATLARNATNLASGTVADARLPVTAQAATMMSTYEAGSSTLIYVTPGGDDGKDGTTWVKAKATIGAAVTAIPPGGGIVQLSAGSFNLTGPVTINARANLTIKGAGANATQVIVNGNYDGLQITGICENVTIKDLWIGTFAARSSGWGVLIFGTSGAHADAVKLYGVTVANTYGGIFVQYADNSRFRNVKVSAYNAGAMANACWSIVSSIGSRLNNCVIQVLGITTGADAFLLDSDTDTTFLTGCEIGGAGGGRFGGRGIHLVNSLGGASTGPRIVRISDTAVECATTQTVLIEDGIDVRIRGGSFNGGLNMGIHVTGGRSITIDGTTVQMNALGGIYITGGEGVQVANCVASNNSAASVGNWAGITVESVLHARINNNRSGDFIWPAAPSQSYGLLVSATGVDYLTATGNDFNANTLSPLSNLSTGAHNILANNQV